MSIPKVSIGLPLYNGEEYLAEALDSLLDQTFDDFEIVIADNGSTDRSVEIARQYEARDNRIRIICRERNFGAVDNFNFVVHQTAGPYFKWAAADDLCRPTFLERCVEILDQDPEVAWCHTKSDRIDSNGESMLDQVPDDDPTIELTEKGKWWRGLPRPNSLSDSPSKRYADVLLGTTWCADSYGLFRRSHLDRTRLYIPLYGAEKVMLAELALYGKYFHIDENLFSQRMHEAASSNIIRGKDQQQFVGAKQLLKGRPALIWAHLWTIARAKIGVLQKLACLGAWTRYVFQFRKWGRIAKALCLGLGNGGDGHEFLQRTARFRKTESANGN